MVPFHVRSINEVQYLIQIINPWSDHLRAFQNQSHSCQDQAVHHTAGKYGQSDSQHAA